MILESKFNVNKLKTHYAFFQAEAQKEFRRTGIRF